MAVTHKLLMILLPIILLGIGFVAWLVRRNR
jgi:hypothetical protein